MKPVDQTILAGAEGPRKGNCFQASVASILEMPIEDVPHFMEEADWRGALLEFLQLRGLYYLETTFAEQYSQDFFDSYGGYHLMSGRGERGINHTVVGLRGKLAHDPHPSRAGLSAPMEGQDAILFGLFIPHDPAKCVLQFGEPRGTRE